MEISPALWVHRKHYVNNTSKHTGGDRGVHSVVAEVLIDTQGLNRKKTYIHISVRETGLLRL